MGPQEGILLLSTGDTIHIYQVDIITKLCLSLVYCVAISLNMWWWRITFWKFDIWHWFEILTLTLEIYEIVTLPLTFWHWHFFNFDIRDFKILTFDTVPLLSGPYQDVKKMFFFIYYFFLSVSNKGFWKYKTVRSFNF